MPVSMDEVRRFLDPEEPDYNEAARQLGPDALPHLEALVTGADPLLASKAAYLAGLLAAERSLPVLQTAARSAHPEVRVAAAAAAQFLPPSQAGTFLNVVVEDSDVGVRKVALRSAAAARAPGLKAKVERLSSSDPSAAIRALAKQTAARLP